MIRANEEEIAEVLRQAEAEITDNATSDPITARQAWRILMFIREREIAALEAHH